MGCCLSSGQPQKGHNRKNPFRECGKDGPVTPAPPPPPPPPAPVEEETVKEVLSETPLTKPFAPRFVPHNVKTEALESEIEMLKKGSAAMIKPVEDLKNGRKAVVKPTAEDIVSEVSEASEMCSFTESFSTTATATEKREDDGEVTQRSPVRVPKKRRNAGDLAAGNERVYRAPVRRSVPSPEKRGQVKSSKPVQGRTMTAQRRNMGPPNRPRPESGEVSGRRSRSPVTRGNVEARGSVRNGSPAPAAKEKAQSPVKNPENGGTTEMPMGEVLPESSESLENPLVSLECFIFL